MDALERKGVIGHIGGHFFDIHGNEPATSLAGRMIGIGVDDLRKCPETICVAYGENKAEAVMEAGKRGLLQGIKGVLISKKGYKKGCHLFGRVKDILFVCTGNQNNIKNGKQREQKKIYLSKTVLIYHRKGRLTSNNCERQKKIKNFNKKFLIGILILDIMYNTKWEVRKFTSRGMKEKE